MTGAGGAFLRPRMHAGGFNTSSTRRARREEKNVEKEVSIMRDITHILCQAAVLACHLVFICLLSLHLGITDADAAETAAQASGPPNILFIIMDDVGIDQMRVFGYGEDNQPRTPNIDTIALAGVRFRNAWAMPECSPSRVSFFTGRYPLRTGVLNISATRDLANSQASPFEVTTPRVLRSGGYKNALFGKWHLTEVPSNDSNGNPNPGNSMGNAAPHDLGWDFYFGDLEGAPRAIDTTAGGVAGSDPTTGHRPHTSCGFVNNARFGACYFSDGSCSAIGEPGDPPSANPGRTCLEQGGILVADDVCQDIVPKVVDFSLFNGYYVSPLAINQPDGSVEVVAGFDAHGDQVNPTDPRAREYLTTQQTTAAIRWIKEQAPGTLWMATVSYSAAHLPVQPPPRALLPADSIDSGQFDCTKLVEQRIIYGQMIEAMDQEIGRLLVEVGLATRTPGGQLDYRPDATNTMIVIVGDNGSYFSTVRLPFDPTRGKGTVYQTGVWVPLIVSGPMVNQANIGSEVSHMVNAAVDVYQFFGEVAGIDVRQAVPRSHALDARPMLPYLTTPGQESIRKSNFTQTGTNLQAPGAPIPPCVLQGLNVCTQIFPFKDLCMTEGGLWYGPDPSQGAVELENCCQVQNEVDPTVKLLAHDAWAVRDNQYKLVRLQIENCKTNQLELKYEFYAINDAAPLPQLDREQDDLLTSTSLPPQGLSPDEQKHFDLLHAELLAILRTEPACPGDGNLDKRVNVEDFRHWQVFADICAQNQNQCSSVYDLNYDAVTDSADRVIIEANFGRRCGVRGFLR
jgi:arylsulfatase A-like enzyme